MIQKNLKVILDLDYWIVRRALGIIAGSLYSSYSDLAGCFELPGHLG